jgi:hypothetical protein
MSAECPRWAPTRQETGVQKTLRRYPEIAGNKAHRRHPRTPDQRCVPGVELRLGVRRIRVVAATNFGFALTPTVVGNDVGAWSITARRGLVASLHQALVRVGVMRIVIG